MILGKFSIKMSKVTLTQFKTRSTGQIILKPLHIIFYKIISSILTKLQRNDHWFVLYQNSKHDLDLIIK